jgi:hypothetical protein
MVSSGTAPPSANRGRTPHTKRSGARFHVYRAHVGFSESRVRPACLGKGAPTRRSGHHGEEAQRRPGVRGRAMRRKTHQPRRKTSGSRSPVDIGRTTPLARTAKRAYRPNSVSRKSRFPLRTSAARCCSLTRARPKPGSGNATTTKVLGLQLHYQSVIPRLAFTTGTGVFRSWCAMEDPETGGVHRLLKLPLFCGR